MRLKRLNIEQETELERIHRLEKTLVTIYDSLPVFIRAAIENQKLQDTPLLPSQTVAEFIAEMRTRIWFDAENPRTNPATHKRSD